MGKGLTVKQSPGKAALTGGSSLASLGKEIRELKSQVPFLTSIENIPIMMEFQELFPIKDQNRIAISDSIKEEGFDQKKAVIIGIFSDGTSSLVDGFTRRSAALDAGLTEIFAWMKQFTDIQEALEWAMAEQLGRRNLGEAEILDYVLKVDQITGKGRKAKDGYKGKSSQRTAEIVGTSSRKVERIRAIAKGLSEEEKEKIRTGQESINSAYQRLKDQKAPNGANKLVPKKKEKAPCGANSDKSDRGWSVEDRKTDIVLVRGEEVITLVSYQTMTLMFNGAPYEAIRKAVEQYMEKILG